MKRSLTRILVFLFLVSGSAVARAQYPYQDHPHMWGGWGGMILGPLMMLVFVAAIVVVVVLLIRWLSGGSASVSAPPPPGKTALDILKERFARGEIDKEEFEERKRILSD